MDSPDATDSAQQRPARDAVAALAAATAELTVDRVPATVRARLRLVLIDLLGVAIAGAGTPEHQRLVDVVDPPPGPARVLGTRRRAQPGDAAWLNGVAACCLELDEGNKYSRGHPAAHVVPAVLAVAEQVGATGAQLCTAVLAGYEVAARIGAGTRLHAGIHPHGTWGAAGAAAGVARLLELDAPTTAAAIDAATGLATATTFGSALDGNAVRNAWVGGANEAGIRAVQLARAGLARNDGTAAATLGATLGRLDVHTITADLDTRWMIADGYVKRHASCAYTHAPADAALELRARLHAPDIDAVSRVSVETYRLAAPLDRTFAVEPASRLAAMFSIPWITGAALRDGVVGPDQTGPAARADAQLQRLSQRVEVRATPAFDDALPDDRGAAVTVQLADGTEHRATVRNPVGDTANLPFGLDEVHDKLVGLLGAERAGRIVQLDARLPAATDLSALLDELEVS